MAKIEIDVKNCLDCPFVRTQRRWTEDSWDHAFDYSCEKFETVNGPRTIAEYIEFPTEMPEIPCWCPIKVKANS